MPMEYDSQVVLRWGEPLFPGAPELDIDGQTAETQAQQFGYNADWVGYFPVPFHSDNPRHGLLAVNHEFTNPELMFPGYNAESPTLHQVNVELAAHGFSIVEVLRGLDWEYRQSSYYNRRVTAETPIEITGPAAGLDLMRTSYDDTGTLVHGTLNNCGGGKTPWGTILTCEENFNQYFAITAACRTAILGRQCIRGTA